MTMTKDSNNGFDLRWMLGLVAAPLVAFMVYCVPKLNEISSTQASILATLQAQSRYQIAQDQINHDQQNTNFNIAQRMTKIETEIGINRNEITRHARSDAETYTRKDIKRTPYMDKQ